MRNNLFNPICTSMIVVLFTALSFAQEGVTVKDAGTFSGKLKGEEFHNMIRYGEGKNLVTIATGDKNFTLTINWEGVSALKEIKSQSINLPDKNNSVKVIYLDNNAGMPSVVTSGTITINNNEKDFSGTLVFTASMGGIPKQMGGTETKLSDGKFTIDMNK